MAARGRSGHREMSASSDVTQRTVAGIPKHQQQRKKRERSARVSVFGFPRNIFVRPLRTRSRVPSRLLGVDSQFTTGSVKPREREVSNDGEFSTR